MTDNNHFLLLVTCTLLLSIFGLSLLLGFQINLRCHVAFDLFALRVIVTKTAPLLW